ncbi:hypothetical protein [Flavobacterium sp.]|uniref:hypothetical protein n=1 Tax=Flavobacterium sp. TaxID=239 RepID=UPI0035B2E85D
MSPKKITNLLDNALLFKIEKKLMVKALFFLLAILSIGTAEAQNAKEGVSITNIDDFVSSLQSSTQRNNNGGEAAKVLSLANDANSSVYLMNNTMNTYGNRPECLFTDVNSFGMITNGSVPMSNVKMVIIKINRQSDLNAKLELSILDNFPSVKYVYILSSVSCTETAVKQVVKNSSSESTFNVFYKIAPGA